MVNYDYYKQPEQYWTPYYRVDPQNNCYWQWDEEDQEWNRQGGKYKGEWCDSHWDTFYDDPQHYPMEVNDPVTPVKMCKLEVLVVLGPRAVKE